MRFFSTTQNNEIIGGEMKNPMGKFFECRKSFNIGIRILLYRVSHTFFPPATGDESQSVRVMVSSGLSLGILRGINRAYNHFKARVEFLLDNPGTETSGFDVRFNPF